MSILLGILTFIITLIFLLLILLLFIPISYKLLIGYKEELYLNTEIKGERLFKFNIKYKEDSTCFYPSFLGFSSNVKTSPRFKDIFNNSDLFKALLHTGIEIINIIKPNALVIKGTVGFADPYNTGMLLGIMAVLDSINESFIINVAPLWEEEYYEGEIHLAGKFVLAIILVKIIKLLLSKPSIKYWRYLRKNKIQDSCNPNF